MYMYSFSNIYCTSSLTSTIKPYMYYVSTFMYMSKIFRQFPGALLRGPVSVSPKWSRLYLLKMSDCVPPAALIARSEFFSVRNSKKKVAKICVYKGQTLKRGTRLLSLIDSVIISGAPVFQTKSVKSPLQIEIGFKKGQLKCQFQSLKHNLPDERTNIVQEFLRLWRHTLRIFCSLANFELADPSYLTIKLQIRPNKILKSILTS